MDTGTPDCLMPDIPAEPGVHFTPMLAEPKASRKTVLKVKCFREAFFKGSNWALVS